MHKSEMTPHQIEACQQLSPTGRKLFGLIEFDDDEKLMLEIRKHPFGLFLHILVAAIIVIIIFAVAFFVDMVMKDEIVNGASSYTGVLYGGALVLSILVAIGVLLTTIVYVNDVIFVTNEKIAQVLYKNIITRKVSQLAIGDVQDVTVNQNGIFARIFNYGTLVVETAGEQNNYTFTYVPSPNAASHVVIQAHEENAAKYGN